MSSRLSNLYGSGEKTKSLCGISHNGFHVFHCLVYLLKQHANRYVDFRKMEIWEFHLFFHEIMNSCTANRWFVFVWMHCIIVALRGPNACRRRSVLLTFGRSAYCFPQGDRISNLRTAAEQVMSCFVESSCERDQIIMWNPPFNVHSTVACSFWLVAIRLEHWKADLT